MRMATSCVLAFLVLAARPALAQDRASDCAASAPVGRVTVTTTSGTSIQGTLLCLSAEQALLVSDGRPIATPMSQVRRIETRSDPVWDGAIKGAAIPLIFWAVFCHDCNGGPLLRAVAAYSLSGLVLDSLDRNSRTIYAGRPNAAVSWRVRF